MKLHLSVLTLIAFVAAPFAVASTQQDEKDAKKPTNVVSRVAKTDEEKKKEEEKGKVSKLFQDKKDEEKKEEKK